MRQVSNVRRNSTWNQVPFHITTIQFGHRSLEQIKTDGMSVLLIAAQHLQVFKQNNCYVIF